ncbi:MAG: ribosome-associated translation inhibitor RaiA [Geothrix sp.]|uniref:ribosome hibernation-promoting factor, HPF/YfiA family n=1 Tax=Geothrix sp. TaxID=1962974 RepID=UPI0018328367|nr:ribosome-associated translation inhibitor RaiA [Geothrix sp.]NWJ39373.1 ribosome-associated translation inhibitor RaiA [Geothrix sp.]WIL19402.1 MAG: ribosome-associated translation inhibitor RaiA [Geothrix sp.]
MKVNYTGRHMELTEPLKQLTKERLDKMATYLDDIIDVHVILSVEKHRHEAEITLKTRASAFVASATTDDMYASITQAVDKLEAQAHKQQDKRNTRPHESAKAGAVEE